jgi:hypothetical protein
MRTRVVVRIVVVAAVTLFALYAPTRQQSANACPAQYEETIEYWRDPVCIPGNPPICEHVEPMLLGIQNTDCQFNTSCEGDCSGEGANRTEYRFKPCPLCGPEEP